MASPTVIKAKVSSSAKPKPIPSSSSTPRVVVRGPALDTHHVARPTTAASAPPTPVLHPRVTAKVTGSARPKPASPAPMVRTRTVSTSRSSPVVSSNGHHSSNSINRARTGSVYSLSAVTSQTHLRPQSPVRSVLSASPRVSSSPPKKPTSPPGSVLSIQSASTSTSTASTSSPVSPRMAPVVRAKLTSTNLPMRAPSPAKLTLPDSDLDEDDEEDEEDEEEESRASTSTKSRASSPDPAVEAKVNRKIADLEITNASLLSINASLEALKSRQQKEIWDLRRRLRETRLALPPPVFKQLSQGAGGELDGGDEEEEEEEEGEGGGGDAGFERLNALVQGLLDDAREALARGTKSKVLSAQEVSAWEGRRKSDADAEAEPREAEGDEEEEREVGAMLERTPSPLPPPS